MRATPPPTFWRGSALAADAARTRLHTVLLAALALGVRVAHIALISGHPLFQSPVIDAQWHHLWAGMVAEGSPLAYAPYFRAPLYPWLLGAVYAVAGSSVTAGVLLSAALATGSTALLHRAALRAGGARTAAACAMLWALWGTDILLSTSLLIAPLYVSLLLASFLACEKRGEAAWPLLGLAAAARPTALLALPALFRGRRPGLRALLLLAVPVFVVWGANAVSGDVLTVLSSQGGVNLYIGNGSGADGVTAFAPPAPGDAPATGDGLPYRDNVQTAARAAYLDAHPGAPPAPSDVSAWWTVRTFRHIASHPLRWLGLEARKLLFLLSPVEVPGNYDLYYVRGLSPVLGALVWPPPASLPMLLLWLLVPGALAVTLRGKAPRTALRALTWAGLLALAPMVFFVTARMRLPMVPFLLLWAVACCARAPGLSLKLAPAGLAAAVLLSLATASGARRAGVNMEFYDALAHYRAGRPEEARGLFLRAVQRGVETEAYDLNRTEAMYNLGVMAAREGRLEEAASWWRAVLDVQPEHPAAREALRRLRESGGAGVDPSRRGG